MSEMNAAVILTLIDKLTPSMKKVVGVMKQVKAAADNVNRGGTGDGLGRQFTRAEVQARKLRIEVGKLKTTLHTLSKNAGGLFKRGIIGGGLFMSVKGLLQGAVVGQMMGPAIAMESFRMQLEQLEGSSAKGKKAMAWITDFATRTPLELPQVISAYTQMKNMGLDPTNGSLQALVDTMAMSGKGFENLDSIILAMGQAWTKTKLQGDDARQLMEAGVPVWDMLAKKMGKTSAEVIKLASKGKLGRKEIQLLIDAMGERAAGASDRFATSWTGIMSNISDAWFQFRVAIADSGPFQELKNNLAGLLEQIKAWQADGTFQRMATTIGTDLVTAIKNMVSAAKGMWAALVVVAGVIDKLATAAGGYENLGYMAIGLFMMGKALGTIVAVAQAVSILSTIASLGGGGAALGLLKIAGGLGAIALALGAIQNYTPDMLNYLDSIDPAGPQPRDKKMQHDNPFAKNWAPVGQEVVNRAGDVAINYLKQQYAQMDAAYTAWNARLHAQLMGLGSQLEAAIASGLSSLFDVGSQWIGSLLEGMKAKVGELIAWAGGVGSQISGALTAGVPAGAVIAGGRGGVQRGPRPSSFKAPSNGGPRALGGSVYKGGTHLVGERGPELMTAKRFGHVTPLSKLGGNTGPTIHMGGITINGDANERTLSKLADMLASRLRSGLHDGAYA
jgi:tape measure domain-containing protein